MRTGNSMKRAAAVVVAIGNRRAAALSRRGAAWLSSAPSAILSAPSRLAGRRGVPRAAGGDAHRIWQVHGQAVIDDAQIDDIRQLDIGLDAGHAMVDRGNHPYRQARREHAALARGYDPIADLHRRARLQV